MLNEKLDFLHETALKSWNKQDRIGTVEMATGTGKGFLALKAILSLPEGSKILYLFEAIDRRRTILSEINKFEKLYGVKLKNKYNIILTTYQTAYKWTDRVFDLVIGDEAHDSLTPSYSNFYFNNKYNALLLISATIDRTIEYDGFTKGDLLDKIAPVCFRYTLDESIKNGTSRKLDIYIVEHELDDSDKYIEAGKIGAKFKTTEKKNYEFWNNRFYKALYASEEDKKDYLINLCSRTRANLLFNLKSKKEIVDKILQVIYGKTIVYANSLDFLNTITSNVISSKNTEDQNDDIFNAFQKEKISYIGSFKKLEQGVNLNNLDNVILASYYGKEKSLLQRLGRIRNTSHKAGSVFIIKTKNTQEEKWLDRILEDKMFNIINCVNVDDALIKYLKNNV